MSLSGTPDNIDIVSKHCVQSIGARVFTPKKGDIVDATTETHIYQVRLTEALISQLIFQKGKDAEIAWMDSAVVVRKKQIAAIGSAADMEVDQEEPTEGKIRQKKKFCFFHVNLTTTIYSVGRRTKTADIGPPRQR